MKFVAVCGFGVGSSLILAMSLQKVADKLGIDAEVENTDLTSAHSIDCDAIAEVEAQVNQFLNQRK